MKKIIFACTAIASLLGATVAQAASEDSNGGRISFYGAVTEVSCSISVDGQDSDATVYLSPVSQKEVNSADTLIKPKSFTIDVSHCQPADTNNETKMISVAWVGGNSLINNQNGYLANTNEASGAENIQFALSTDMNLASDKKIIPGDINQPKVSETIIKDKDGTNISRFNYYVGYVTSTPADVTTGVVTSYATYQVTYE